MWKCHHCGERGNPSGYKATVDAITEHFHHRLCTVGSYSYGGRTGDRTLVHVRAVGGFDSPYFRLEHTLARDGGSAFGFGWRKEHHPSEMVPKKYHLVGREIETDDIVTLTVRPIDVHNDTFNPGQFVMLGVPGTGEVPISISGRDKNGNITLTVRNVGRVTSVLTNLQGTGSIITVRGPYGHGWEVPKQSDVLIIGGGCGMAPLHPAITYINEHRNEYGKVTVLQGAKRGSDLLYTDEMQDWIFNKIQTYAISDTTGFVTELIGPHLITDNITVLICGPEIMMNRAIDVLTKLGVPADRMQVSLERHMICGIGLCGKCQCGNQLVCQDGPVFTVETARAAWKQEKTDLKLAGKAEPNTPAEQRVPSLPYERVMDGRPHPFANRMNRRSGIGLTAHGFRRQYAKAEDEDYSEHRFLPARDRQILLASQSLLIAESEAKLRARRMARESE